MVLRTTASVRFSTAIHKWLRASHSLPTYHSPGRVRTGAEPGQRAAHRQARTRPAGQATSRRCRRMIRPSEKPPRSSGRNTSRNWTFGSVRVAVEGQVRLEGAHADIGHEGDHVAIGRAIMLNLATASSSDPARPLTSMTSPLGTECDPTRHPAGERPASGVVPIPGPAERSDAPSPPRAGNKPTN